MWQPLRHVGEYSTETAWSLDLVMQWVLKCARTGLETSILLRAGKRAGGTWVEGGETMHPKQGDSSTCTGRLLRGPLRGGRSTSAGHAMVQRVSHRGATSRVGNRRPLFTFSFAPNLSRQRHPSLLRAPEPDLYTTAAVESFRLLALSEFLSIKPWHAYELVCESFGTAFRSRSPNYAVFAELWSDSGVTKQPCFLVGTQCRRCPEPVLPPRMRHEHPLHGRKAAPFRMATRRTHRWPHPSSEGCTFCTRVIRVR